MLATQSPRMPLATGAGERHFTSPIDQIGLTGILYFYPSPDFEKKNYFFLRRFHMKIIRNFFFKVIFKLVIVLI